MATPPATQLHTFYLNAPLQRVLPLFTAQGERAWAQGWDPKVLSGSQERGSAFVTRGHNGLQTTWIVIDYRPGEGRVSYARLAQGSNIGLVDVQCTEQPGGGTEVAVRYTLTGLNEAGNAFVADFLTDEHYAAMIEEWRVATTKVLEQVKESR